MNRTVTSLSLLCFLCLSHLASAGQQSPGEIKVPALPKEARAMRVEADAVKLDGRLDEAFWEKAQPITDFLQAEPNEGAAPIDGMEVRFVYDETALWIGARMRGDTGGAIQAPMSRRDNGDQA